MGQTGDTVSIAELLDERRHLLDVAHWMLGPGPEAEDAVAETYRRWYGLTDACRAAIVEPRIWLTRTTGTICSARLSPLAPLLAHADAERAAVALSTPLRTVADLGGRTSPPCAELADHARRSLRSSRTRPTTMREHDAIVRAVRQACSMTDVTLLASLLAPDATAFFDGGGKVRALTRPIHGSQDIARTLLALIGSHPHTTLRLRSANGRTAIVVHHDDEATAVISFDATDHRVTHVWAVLNPDKLRSWNRPRTPLNGRGTPSC
ncbi:sigma factor [Streptomyces sp. NRRL F-5123]|uniref:sigma factor n=1 Tax=Streptomyces sp. NRRL F-5123 TaxID=1463856 RepID=UPI0004E1D71C|nr:sigma factor [Streptomyces sp. NRRL F-5123]